MNLNQIKAEILTGSFDNAQLQELIETVQYARAQLGKSVKRQLQPGVSVSFVSNRSGSVPSHSCNEIRSKDAPGARLISISSPSSPFPVFSIMTVLLLFTPACITTRLNSGEDEHLRDK